MCERTCTRCSETHPIAFFNRDRTRADGLYPQCKNCSRRSVRRQYTTKRPAHMARKRAWKDTNRERSREINTAWRLANPEKCKRYDAERRMALRLATPPWVDRKVLAEFRERRPPGHHVDHIEPLQRWDRCGLNVPWNLQYLPAELSYKKGNRTMSEFVTGGYNL